MGSRGPKPNRQDPMPTTRTKLPPPPSHLNAAAKREYRRAAEQLAEIGVGLEAVDSALLAVYAQSWADVIRLTQEIRDEGEVVAGYRGAMRRNPKLGILKSAADRVQATAKLLGLSPSSRKQLPKVARPDNDSPLSKFMEGRK